MANDTRPLAERWEHIDGDSYRLRWCYGLQFQIHEMADGSFGIYFGPTGLIDSADTADAAKSRVADILREMRAELANALGE